MEDPQDAAPKKSSKKDTGRANQEDMQKRLDDLINNPAYYHRVEFKGQVTEADRAKTPDNIEQILSLREMYDKDHECDPKKLVRAYLFHKYEYNDEETAEMTRFDYRDSTGKRSGLVHLLVFPDGLPKGELISYAASTSPNLIPRTIAQLFPRTKIQEGDLELVEHKTVPYDAETLADARPARPKLNQTRRFVRPNTLLSQAKLVNTNPEMSASEMLREGKEKLITKVIASYGHLARTSEGTPTSNLGGWMKYLGCAAQVRAKTDEQLSDEERSYKLRVHLFSKKENKISYHQFGFENLPEGLDKEITDYCLFVPDGEESTLRQVAKDDNSILLTIVKRKLDEMKRTYGQ